MKKVFIYILLSLHVFFTGNIGVFVNNYFSSASAASDSWDFSTSGDYTLSNTTGAEITGGLGALKKRFEHIGFVKDNINLNSVYDVVVDGNYAYLTSNANGTDLVAVVDISDPTNPSIATTIQDGVGGALLDGASSIEKIGNYLYIASQISDAIQVIDVTDPLAPIVGNQVVNITTPTNRRLDGPVGLVVDGDHLYVAALTGRALITIDVTNPAVPVYLDTDRETINLRSTRDLIVKGDHIIATSNASDRVTSLNITNPADPILDDSIEDNTALNTARHIVSSGNYAYVSANNNDSVEVIDITDPSNLVQETTISGGSFLLDQPRGSEIVDDVLFVTANLSDAVNAIDISDPTAPIFLESITDSSGGDQELNGARGITSVGNRLFIAAGVDDALEILDFDYDTTSPTITANTPFDFTGEDLSSFSETLGGNNTGNITYQISRNNGTDWHYYDGSAWILTTGGVAESSSAADINTNIGDFNSVGSGNEFLWKAFLTSDGNQKVEIDNISVESESSTPSILEFSVVNDNNFGSGFCYTFGVEHVGDEPITNWVIGFSLPNGTINNSFTEEITNVGGDNYEVTSGLNNANTDVIKPGDTFTVGFCGSGNNVEYPDDISLSYFEPISGGDLEEFTIEANGLRVDVTTSSGDVGNYCRLVTLTNIGTNVINDWQVNFELDQTLASSYNGVFTVNGINHSVTPLSWNSTINVGANRTLGFCTVGSNVDSEWTIGIISNNGSGDTTPPVISSTDPIDEANISASAFDIEINYTDELTGSGIDINSGNIELVQWDGFNWGVDISSTYIGSETITITKATYPVSGIPTGRYKIDFNISDLNLNLSSTSFIINVDATVVAGDVIAPTIDSINYASGILLPGGDHDFIINYSDDDSGIDTSTSIMQLYKWDGVSSYGANIAGVGINFNSASTSSASYSTNNLSFGKYQYRFSISDNDGNSVVEIVDFYIDIPEFIIGTGSIDMGTLDPFSNIFSDTVTITVKTIGADFDVTMSRNTGLMKGIDEIPIYDGSLGYGYQQTPYSNTLSSIGISQTIAGEVENINTNGLKNTYTYDIQIGALIELQQAAGEYMGSLDFGISLTY